jgi:hypothetical protein
MADVNVKNSSTGDMGTIAAKRTRYEKMETAYGKIPAAAWEADDTLIFDQIPMLNLVHAKFVAGAGAGEALELFHGADLSDPIDWDIVNDGDSASISYVIEYVRGTGKVASNEDQGKVIKLTIASTAP